MMEQKYQPINCHYYDELELLAIRRKKCAIIFKEGGVEQTIADVITDFQIIDRAEYLLLKSGKRIRLDYLISVDGKVLKGYC